MSQTATHLPAPADEVRREIQRILGFTGRSVDGDFGSATQTRFDALVDDDPKLGTIQELLGFKGKDVDLDLGPSTRFRFQQLGDHPDAAPWPGQVTRIDPANPKPPTSGPDTRPMLALHPPLTSAARAEVFGGPFQWSHRPRSGNPEHIVIAGNWESANIVTIDVPQLLKVPGNFSRMRLNKRVADQTVALWRAWEKEGLLALVLSYEGSFVARLLRGSTTSLSNHAHGSAFDQLSLESA